MIILNYFINPIFLFFSIIIVGCFIGKIKVYGISLDIAAILIIAILVGFMLTKFDVEILTTEFNAAMSCLSKLGTAIFMSVIGISSCQCITKFNIKNYTKYMFFGAVLVCMGFVVAKIIGLIDTNLDSSLLLGILCGALTSSPGLATVCEMQKINPAIATAGYSVTYLFGVIAVVLYVQFFSSKITKTKITKTPQVSISQNGMESLLFISITAILGQVIGCLKLPIVDYSLGITGGTLISGILCGIILNRFLNIKNKLVASLNIYRNFGLTMFFVGNGILAGQNFNTILNIRCLFYGLIITTTCVFLGNIISHLYNKGSIASKMSMVAGGMTSSPAMAVVLQKTNSETETTIFSLTYVGALITMIFGLRIF